MKSYMFHLIYWLYYSGIHSKYRLFLVILQNHPLLVSNYSKCSFILSLSSTLYPSPSPHFYLHLSFFSSFIFPSSFFNSFALVFYSFILMIYIKWNYIKFDYRE